MTRIENYLNKEIKRKEKEARKCRDLKRGLTLDKELKELKEKLRLIKANIIKAA